LSLAAIVTCFSTASYGKHNPTRSVLSILHRCAIHALWRLRCDFHHDDHPSNFTLMGYFKDLATNTLSAILSRPDSKIAKRIEALKIVNSIRAL